MDHSANDSTPDARAASPDAATRMRDCVLYGDALVRLADIPDGIVQTCVCSPPYWSLRDYGTRSWFGGDSGCDHDQRATDNRSVWRGGDGGLIPARSCLCGAWFGQIGLEPTMEMYVQHLVAIFNEVRRVLTPTGSLWLNLGDVYNAYGNRGRSKSFSGRTDSARATWVGGGLMCPTRKNKELLLLPPMVAFALDAHGWWLRRIVIWEKPKPQPERVRDRPSRSHEYVFLFSKAGADCYLDSDDDESTVWSIRTRPYRGVHRATFPEELPQRCIRLSARPGDIVLDPFAGSGTTLAVAKSLGRHYLGIEPNEAFRPLIDARLSVLNERR